MEALLGRVARLGAGVAGAAFVGNNFLFNGAFPWDTHSAPRNSRPPDRCPNLCRSFTRSGGRLPCRGV